MTLTVEYYFTHPWDELDIYAGDPEDNSQERGYGPAELVVVEGGHGLHVINGRPLCIQQGDVFCVQPGDVHCYDELGMLELTNVLINPVVAFHYLQQIEGLLQQLPARRAACYGWLAPETRSYCRELVEKIFSPTLKMADNTS